MHPDQIEDEVRGAHARLGALLRKRESLRDTILSLSCSDNFYYSSGRAERDAKAARALEREIDTIAARYGFDSR